MAAPSVTPPLSFSLLLQPAGAGSQWRAELCDANGVRTVFTTPLDLLRYLAEVAGAQSDQGGLR